MRRTAAPSVVAIICAMATLLVTDRIALAQAGSTGGTVGNTDKSVSGGDEQKAPPRANLRQSPRTFPAQVKPAGDRRETGSPCGRLVGTWKWFNGVDVVFKANGTAEATNGDTSKWVCDGGMYRVTWKSFGQTDRITLAPDGQTLSGTSSLLGIAVSGTRT